MTRAAVYARYSSALQSESSIDAQVRACRELCAQRGYTVVAEHIDREESGSSTRRPGYRALMDDVRAKRIDIVVTHKLDRLSRNMTDVVLTMRELNQHGVQYVSVLEQFDFTTPVGRIILAVLAALAEWYLANLKTEINKGKRQRAISGKSNASIMPFGYRRDAGAAVPDDDAQHVRWAFNAYAGGLHSYRDIAHQLNQHGCTTRRGGPWSVESVREMLQNPFYAGWVTERGLLDQQTASGTRRRVPRSQRRLYRGTHEPIIAQELFDRCQARMRERRAAERGRRPVRVEQYLLAGIAHCAHCGRRLIASAWADGRYPRYTCRAMRLNLPCDARRRSIAESALVAQIDARIAAISLPAEIERRAVEIANGQLDRGEVERRRRSLQAERDRLNTMFQKGFLDEARWEAEVSRVTRELADLHAPVDAPAAIEQLHQLIDLWQAASQAERAAILKTLYASVTVDLDAGTITEWTPRREFLGLA